MDMTIHETVGVLILAIIGSGAFSSVISILLTRYFEKKDKEVIDLDEIKTSIDLLKDALEAVVHDSYFRQTRHLLSKDTITEEELENHNYLYNAYHSQGLNGTGDRLHQLVLEKEVKYYGEK